MNVGDMTIGEADAYRAGLERALQIASKERIYCEMREPCANELVKWMHAGNLAAASTIEKLIMKDLDDARCAPRSLSELVG